MKAFESLNASLMPASLLYTIFCGMFDKSGEIGGEKGGYSTDFSLRLYRQLRAGRAADAPLQNDCGLRMSHTRDCRGSFPTCPYLPHAHERGTTGEFNLQTCIPDFPNLASLAPLLIRVQRLSSTTSHSRPTVQTSPPLPPSPRAERGECSCHALPASPLRLRRGGWLIRVQRLGSLCCARRPFCPHPQPLSHGVEEGAGGTDKGTPSGFKRPAPSSIFSDLTPLAPLSARGEGGTLSCHAPSAPPLRLRRGGWGVRFRKRKKTGWLRPKWR